MKQIKILGIPFSLSWRPRRKSWFGKMQPDLRYIEVNTRSCRGRLDLMESTLFHECIHGVLAISGQNQDMTPEREESLVLALEHGLWPLVDEIRRCATEAHRRRTK